MSTEIKRQNIPLKDRIFRYAGVTLPAIMRSELKNKRVFWIAAALLLLSLTACTGRGAAEAGALSGVQYVFSYAENQEEGYPTTEAAHYFAGLVQERSQGRILIRVQSGGSLGDEVSVAKQVAYGGIDFARVSIASLEEETPVLPLLSLPYLFRDSGHMWRVLDGPVGEELMERLSGTGLRGLSWYGAGARSFYSCRGPIRSPSDMEGLRIRVQDSRIMSSMVRAMGATPVQAVFADVREMLELGEIDGAENNPSSYLSQEHYRQARYLTLDEHSRIPELQLISQATWEQLTPEDQELIGDCARESAVYERELWSQYEEYALDTVKKEGCEVIILTEEERRAFQDCARDIYEDWFSQEGALLEAIRNTE